MAATRFSRSEIRKILGDAHTEEIENQLIALHLGVVDPLKDDLARYKADADKLPGVQAELDTMKSGKDWKAEYDKLDKSFKDYKSEVDGKEKLSAKQAAYRKLLEAENIPAKFHDRIIKMTDFDAVELDGDTIKDESSQRESIKREWGEYVATTDSKGEQPETPPKGKTTMTRAEILAIKDTSARQKAIAENLELFGK